MENRDDVKRVFDLLEDLKPGYSCFVSLTKYDAFFVAELYIPRGYIFRMEFKRIDPITKLAEYDMEIKRKFEF